MSFTFALQKRVPFENKGQMIFWIVITTKISHLIASSYLGSPFSSSKMVQITSPFSRPPECEHIYFKNSCEYRVQYFDNLERFARLL